MRAAEQYLQAWTGHCSQHPPIVPAGFPFRVKLLEASRGSTCVKCGDPCVRVYKAEFPDERAVMAVEAARRALYKVQGLP